MSASVSSWLVLADKPRNGCFCQHGDADLSFISLYRHAYTSTSRGPELHSPVSVDHLSATSFRQTSSSSDLTPLAPLPRIFCASLHIDLLLMKSLSD